MKTIDLNIDNATLVQECRSGDRGAMGILYTRFAPRMLRFISRYVADQDNAQDILHDGFIAAFTHLDTLRDPEQLDFWLATIMKNLSLKFLQAQSVSSILEEIPEEVDESDSIGTLDFATLESLIRQLPEGYQKVFRLAVLEGKSHKEISEILGIAPNSSSSQLFHAKLRLRQLVRDYQLRTGLISLMLMLVSAGLLFIRKNPDKSGLQDHLASHSDSQKRSGSPANATLPTTPYPQAISIPSVSMDTDPAEGILSESPALPHPERIEESDSTSTTYPADNLQPSPTVPVDEEDGSFYDRLLADVPVKSVADKGWSTGISVDPGLLSFNGSYGNAVSDDFPRPDDPIVDPDDPEDKDTPSRRAAQAIDTPESYLATAARHHYLPISFAVTAEKRFASWLGVESGIGYSYLHTDFERYGNNGNEISTCHWHYLEIPLKVNLYAYSNPRFRLYASVGGRVAIPVYSYAAIPANPYCRSGRFDSKPVWSVGGSVGVAFRLSKRIDLFIEPSLRYHFQQDCALPNIWTDDEPFSLSLPLGIRFSW